MGDIGKRIKESKMGEFASTNPYLFGAAVIMGGISYFSSRRAEKRRRKKLKRQMGADIAGVQGGIGDIQQEYAQTANMYRSSGNVMGEQIYGTNARKMQMGGQSNLAFGQENTNRGEIGGLLGQQLQRQNLQTSSQVFQTQNQLASELNRQQINIDEIRAGYAQQGISSDEVSIGDVNQMKYV